MCCFINDCVNLTVGSLSFLATEDSIIAQIQINNISDNLINDVIRGTKSVPFSNRNAMKYLQDRDPDLCRVRELLLSGQRPGNKENLSVKRYMQKHNNLTIARDGCLVVIKRSNRNLVTRELIVLPDDISMGLLYSIHINLNHPTVYQLTKTIETRFFVLDRDRKVNSVWSDCTLYTVSVR